MTMYLSLLKYGLSSTVATLALSNIVEKRMLNFDTEVQPPVDMVSIIIPSLDEEVFIERCLSSLRNQSIVKQYPEYFEYILVDNGSFDNTVNLAKPYVDKIFVVPRGKLNSRNLATLYSNGNIIVAVDSDIEFPYHYLNTLLKPFNDPSIAGVSGSIIDYNLSHIPKSLYVIAASFDRKYNRPYRMIGGNCAYWKHLFYLTNQFDTSINQLNGKEMIQEEELNFGLKLSKYGKILYKHNASGLHLGGERTSCRMGLKTGSACNKYNIGIARFG